MTVEANTNAHHGACRCGTVRFTATGRPMVTMACHCTGCQRMSASAFSLSALFPAAAFAVTQGEPVLGGLRGEIRHYFCPDCMSWLFTRFDAPNDLVNVRSALLDDAADFPPYIETCVLEALPWAKTPAVHHFNHFPDTADYPKLMAGYADWRP